MAVSPLLAIKPPEAWQLQIPNQSENQSCNVTSFCHRNFADHLQKKEMIHAQLPFTISFRRKGILWQQILLIEDAGNFQNWRTPIAE